MRGAFFPELYLCFELARRLAQSGLAVQHLPRGRSLATPVGPAGDVVTWEGDVAGFVAAIAAADLYLGYDSAGQHLAAALGVPTLSVFVEAAGRRHGRRWTPRGAGLIRIVRSPYPPQPEALERAARESFSALADQVAQRSCC